jgi:hypothetical protein
MSRPLPLLLLLLFAGCQDSLVLPSEGAPNLVTILQGDGQQGTVGQPLGDSLAIRVTDARGRPVVELPVAVNLVSGGSVTPAGLLTDQDGRVAFRWVLATVAGAQTLEVGAGDGGQISPKAVFVAAALAGPVSTMSRQQGDHQSGQTGTVLPESLIVRLADDFGNPVSGVGVTWTAADGSVSPGAVLSDDGGLARAEWTLGITVGGQTATAHLDPIPGTEVDFSATATPGPPSILAIAVQPPDLATVGTPFTRHPVIQVEDANGTPVAVPGIVVTAALSSTTGTLGGTVTRTTDAAGLATFDDLFLLGPAGSYTLFFAAPGYVSVTSNPIALASRQPSSALSTVELAPSILVAGGGAAEVTVVVRDAGNTPIAGVAVTLSASGMGNTLVQPTALTDGSGVARGSISSTVAEEKRVTAMAGAVRLDQVATLEVIPGAPTPSATTADVHDGHRFRSTPITIRTRDGFGNDLKTGGYAGQLAVRVSGANSASPSVVDNGDGTYSASYFPLFSGDDEIAITLNGVAIKGSPYRSKVKK